MLLCISIVTSTKKLNSLKHQLYLHKKCSQLFIRLIPNYIHFIHVHEIILVFENTDDPEHPTIFSDFLASVWDAQFLSAERKVVTRDFMSLKVWDMAMESQPAAVIPLNTHLRPVLSELYANETIFDRFEVSCDASGKRFVTGSYHRLLHLFEDGEEVLLEANRQQPRPLDPKRVERCPEYIDFETKALNVALHPTEMICCASVLNNLYIFSGK